MKTVRYAPTLLGLTIGTAIIAERTTTSDKVSVAIDPVARIAPPRKRVASTEKFFPSTPAAPRNVRNRRKMASASRKRNHK